MPSLNDFATQYADYLKRHLSSPTIISDVANKIKNLTYTESGEYLSARDIDRIIDEIQNILLSKKSASGGGFLHEAEDSSEFIRMVQMIRQEAKRK